MALFIVFDGLDGSGKGDMIRLLRDYLSEKHLHVLVTREPTEGQYGKKIRKMLRKDIYPKEDAELCLHYFVKDREEHLKKEIEPALKKGTTVISDRYYYSTIAFQNTQGIDIEQVVFENMAFRTPDIAFILDLPPGLALERIEKRGSPKEKFEQPDFMKELRQNFLRLKEKLDDPIKIIDASKPRKEVFAQIKKEIDRLL